MNKIIKVTNKQNAFELAKMYLDKNLSDNPNKHFKIGKTELIPLEKRLEKEDYKCVYRKIIALYADTDLDLISSLETDLIQYCLENHRGLCNNNPNRGEIVPTGAASYSVYVVIQ